MDDPPRSQRLTVLELFQSQGCSSCPPTNDNLFRLSKGPALLILTFDVTYRDYLGWTDSFGSSAFDMRQRAYAKSLKK